MAIRFDPIDENTATLLCPHCGGNNLHHERIDAFERDEYAKEGLHASIADEKLSVDRIMTGNPSTRKHGLTITLRCEHCEGETVKLKIAQHKGLTLLSLE